MMVSVLVPIDLVVGYLLDTGRLPESESEDPRAVGHAISKLVRTIAMLEVSITHHAPSPRGSGSSCP